MRASPTLWTVGRLAALVFFLVLPASAAPPANSPDATTLGPDEARRRLTADCDFFQNLTLFDLEIRLQKKLKPADHAHGPEESEYDGGGLFNYVAFGFLELQRINNRYTAKLDNSGRPVLLEPRQLQSLFEQIGRNTQYLIHPDEILADNFKLLLAYKAPERRSTIAARYDTKLLDRIDAVLGQKRSPIIQR